MEKSKHNLDCTLIVKGHIAGDRIAAKQGFLPIKNPGNTFINKQGDYYILTSSGFRLCKKDPEEFSYDLPVGRPKTRTVLDTSRNYGGTPGMENTEFGLVFNTRFSKGDIISYDAQYGHQLVVESVSSYDTGPNIFYKTVVTYNTTDRTKYFPKDKMREGIVYVKIGNSVGEYSRSISDIAMSADELPIFLYKN